MDGVEQVDKLVSSGSLIRDEILLLGALRACPAVSSSQQRRDMVYKLDGVRTFPFLLLVSSCSYYSTGVSMKLNGHDRRTWLRIYLENMVRLHELAFKASESPGVSSE